jgi:hypothetical protein
LRRRRKIGNCPRSISSCARSRVSFATETDQCPSSSWSFFFWNSSISLTWSSVIFWT